VVRHCHATTNAMAAALNPAPTVASLPSALHPSNPFLYLPPAPTRFSLHASYRHPVVGGRVLVVGDVHGCLDELQALVEQENIQPGRDMVIAAGDLVGKGPKSKQVVEFLMNNGQRCRRVSVENGC
jgi:hypothetical protein